MTNCVIEARSYRLAIWSHDFWVLKNRDTGEVIAELHGLATCRVTGRIIPIGTTRQHSLRVYVFPHEPNYAESLRLPPRSTRMIARSVWHPVYEQGDAFSRWKTAVEAIPSLNKLDLDYPPFGFNLLKPTINSNSAYRTFGEIMGVPIYRFPRVLQPGHHNPMANFT